MLDLDNFKYVNDVLGHATGDALLAQIGNTIKEGDARYRSARADRR